MEKDISLVEKAKSFAVSRRNLSARKGELELALAWIKGEVNGSQVSRALDDEPKSNNILYRVALLLREAYAKGLIVEKKK